MKANKKLAYVEPDDYFPKSVREKYFEKAEEADAKKEKTKDKKYAEDKSS